MLNPTRRTHGKFVSVDLDALIEKMFVSPKTDAKLERKVKSAIGKHKLEKKVFKSDLAKDPFY